MLKRNRPHIIANILIVLIVFLFWWLIYSNHLLKREQMQLFLFTSDFLHEYLSVPGGLANYLGMFIIQFFIQPFTAALLLTFLFFTGYWLTRKFLLKLAGSSGVLPLSILPAIFYMILFTDENYLLGGWISYILLFFGLLLYIARRQIYIRLLTGVALLIALYWLAGAVWLPFLLTIVIIEWQYVFKQGKPIKEVIFLTSFFLISGILVTLLSKKYFGPMNMIEAIYSFSYYRFALIFPMQLKLLLLFIPALVTLHILFLNKTLLKFEAHIKGFLSALMIFFFGFGLLKSIDLDTENNIQYQNLVYHQKWDEIVELSLKSAPGSPEAKSALVLALAKTNQIGYRFFEYDLQFEDFLIPYNRRGTTSFISADALYYMGLVNFSKMFAIETIESTPDAAMPVRSVKMAVKCYLITDELKVAQKYIDLLKNTLFYRNFALEAEAYMNSENSSDLHHELEKIKRLQPLEEFLYQADRMEDALMYLLRSNTRNKLAYEYLMFKYLLEKDLERVLNYLPLAYNMNYEEIPLLFIEALAYISTIVPELPSGLNMVQFDSAINTRINRYANLFRQRNEANIKVIRSEFGSSYWYYLHFR